MFIHILIICIYLSKPTQLSFLSRIKNRYEYIPQEENVTTEELYDFPITSPEQWIAQTITRGIENDKNIDDIYYIEPLKDPVKKATVNIKSIGYDVDDKTTVSKTSEVENFSPGFDVRPTIGTTEKERISSEYAVKIKDTTREKENLNYGFNARATIDVTNPTKTFEIHKAAKDNASQVENLSYDFDVWPETLPQWRPTLIMNTDELATWKRRRTFQSHFPTKNTPFVTDVSLTTTRTKAKSRMLPWIVKMYNKPIRRKETFQPKNATQTLFRNIKRTKTIRPMRRQGSKSKEAERSKTSYCYLCGLDQGNIPKTATCYSVFESPDGRYRRLQKRYEVQCIPGSSRWKGKKIYSPHFRQGCFKRYLDVGVIYNERGCRTKKGWYGQSYASHRLVKLEMMLEKVEDGCVFSPQASLTPFSRAVSLYARYHSKFGKSALNKYIA
ncbi:unnamed protein product [Colias eurytheme]|nr:unnamed protein product [Colias eurytheme]